MQSGHYSAGYYAGGVDVALEVEADYDTALAYLKTALKYLVLPVGVDLG